MRRYACSIEEERMFDIEADNDILAVILAYAKDRRITDVFYIPEGTNDTVELDITEKDIELFKIIMGWQK